MQLHRWDVSYYSERLRERRYDVDQEALRKYFPMPQTLDWLLHVSSRVFGVRFQAAAVPVWHEDVRYYDVIDASSGAQIGGIYCDLFPREGKFTHAAAWPVRGASRRAGRTPITVMVANFDRRGLTHDEVETFFHEFGHVLHGVLSETHYNQHAGTNVERDFVEAPSQIYEEWTRRLESLATIRDVCPDCPVMDAALVDRLNAARRFGAGMQYARQHLYATFDMTLYGEHPRPAFETWKEMEEATRLGFVPGTNFPATFSHIAGGYAAGYYGYMWAEVIALDMLSAFGGSLINRDVGLRFRKEILSRGGEERASVLVERFLGRGREQRGIPAGDYRTAVTCARRTRLQHLTSAWRRHHAFSRHPAMELEHQAAGLHGGILGCEPPRLLGGRVEHEDAGQVAVVDERSRRQQLA